MKSRWSISRRTMLRGALGGAAVSIGLPPLEAMLNANATAHADGSGLPRRFGVFFWANGKTWTHDNKPDLWTPPSSGADWQPSELLAPLAENKGYVNVVTGLTPKTTWTASPAGQEDGHMRGAACALTSDRCMPEGFSHPDHVFAFSRATIDQYIATHPQFYGGSPTRFRSLELSVSDIRFHDYGHWNCISHSGPNMLNLPIRSIAPLYSKLFGVPPDTKVLGARSSVIDAVSDDAKSLMRRLGNRDRQRVEAHLSHLNEINRRLNSGAALCQSPAQPGDYGNPTPSDQLHAKLGAMTDLLVVALQCDLTRVFTMMFSSPATNQVFRESGATTSMHQHCHDGAWEVIRQTTKFQMQAFNLFLTKLRNAADVEGQLLDNTLVFGTSEYGEGNNHGVGEFPVLLAGKASGGMATGVHVREPGGNLSKTHVTILRALGIDTPSYGFNGAETSDDFLSAFRG